MYQKFLDPPLDDNFQMFFFFFFAFGSECFLQMKPDSTILSQCPFCKTFNYAVEYRGVKAKEEKGLEQIEEQRVIDAKIRMRLQEIQDEEERMQRRQDMSSSSGIIVGEEIVSTQPLGGSVVTNPSGTWQNRYMTDST
ncbi:putative protein Sip5/DA2 [Helianthus annuus]|nr:putative protein Sip5/DA2 [Helianthus annuus]KAJ0701026.1 putative protein Sip5/DA2 [Helianthus annuus]